MLAMDLLRVERESELHEFDDQSGRMATYLRTEPAVSSLLAAANRSSGLSSSSVPCAAVAISESSDCRSATSTSSKSD